MRTPHIAWPLLLTAMVVGVVSPAQEAPQTNSAVRITEIKYCLEPFRTFEIVGTDARGVKKLRDLTKALRKHKERNPAARYEVLAEVKSVAEGEKEIVEAVAKAGITLEHYWAATSSWTPGEPTGPHGSGYVDIIGNYKALR